MLQLKTDHTEPSQALPFATPPIPRITVKLETASQPALLANKGVIKTETSQMYVLWLCLHVLEIQEYYLPLWINLYLLQIELNLAATRQLALKLALNNQF